MDPEGTRSIGVIAASEAATAVLHPLRMRILASLREPRSAAGLAQQLGLPRQKVNYHLRELERHRLVELVEERRKGNCVERILRTASRSYVLSPEVLGSLAADPDEIRDRFSSAYLTALAARAVEDLGQLRQGAQKVGKGLATISLTTEVRFASPAERGAFAQELAETVARLVEKYHDETAEGGRRFRFLLGGYPAPATRGRRTTDGTKGPNPRKKGD